MRKSSKAGKIDFNNLAEAFKSIGHPERLAILYLMCNCGCDQVMVKNIYETLQLEQSITSRHLGIMKKGRLLKREVKGGKTLYGFNTESLAAQCIKKILTE